MPVVGHDFEAGPELGFEGDAGAMAGNGQGTFLQISAVGASPWLGRSGDGSGLLAEAVEAYDLFARRLRGRSSGRGGGRLLLHRFRQGLRLACRRRRRCRIELQQYHALMAENGVLDIPDDEMATMALQISRAYMAVA